MIYARASTIIGPSALTESPSAHSRFGLLFFAEFGMRGVVDHEKVSREVAKVGGVVRFPPIRGVRVQERLSSSVMGSPNKSSHVGEEIVSRLVSRAPPRCRDTHQKHGPQVVLGVTEFVSAD